METQFLPQFNNIEKNGINKIRKPYILCGFGVGLSIFVLNKMNLDKNLKLKLKN